MKIQSILILVLVSILLDVACEGLMTFGLNNIKGVYKNLPGERRRYLNSKDDNAEMSQIYGNSTYLNYYYINVHIGTPPQSQALIIDTGSHLTAVPCLPHCKDCGKHINSYYDMSKSSTSETVQCGMSSCSTLGYTRCLADNTCGYSMSYGEGSSLSGLMVSDIVVLGDYVKQTPANIPFGCTTRENKLFFTQEADGIMGIGPGNSIISFLANEKAINDRIFSICYAPNSGYFSIGGYNSTLHSEEVKYIPFYPGQYYKVKLIDITLNNQDIEVSDNTYFTIIDSGTTITYFPRALFSQVEKQVNSFCSQMDKCLGDSYKNDLGLCFRLKDSVTPEKFIKSLPPLIFIFENNIKYNWKPEYYSYNSTEEGDSRLSFCMGFASWNSNEILLGSTWMHNYDIIFDNTNNRIGFAESNCSGVMTPPQSNNNLKPSNDTNLPTPVKPEKCKDVDNSFYVNIIILLGILVIMLFLILALTCYRFKNGQGVFWVKLQNEDQHTPREMDKIRRDFNNI